MHGHTREQYAESCYAEALVAVALGETREHTIAVLIDQFPALEPHEVANEAANAYRDALKQGVEREDIDDSWHAA